MRRGSSSSVRVFYPRFNREQIIQAIRGKLPELNGQLPLMLVVLFGSYAKGNYTVASDVDLLVVYRGRERKKAFATIKKVLGIPHLEPHVYSQAEYKAMHGTIEGMIRDGVVLFQHKDGQNGVLWNNE